MSHTPFITLFSTPCGAAPADKPQWHLGAPARMCERAPNPFQFISVHLPLVSSHAHPTPKQHSASINPRGQLEASFIGYAPSAA
ncbi:hypothetical protein HYPSUDRAFT_70840 [Hypholoma sublateritium FD-334 SS-4]|uniref:Uncharacterized protein n=1 Tax=Hypholoma sublateritium (strain FD-334 SS-4) TaxID=945553 RepID=A0A0D2NE13_HYPSF|nr:hypothetical protein HYPSUDRAFT_70840 [Hypholoma sublateritium FD-334 SS-4]